MGDDAGARLAVVDGLELDAGRRAALRPGEPVRDARGRIRHLPRFFWRVNSWEQALDTPLAPHFRLYEFLDVDVREDPMVREYPRYLPPAVGLLAATLSLLRDAADTYVHVAANGGYRSPAHALSQPASAHCWGTAANLYRVGDEWLDEEPTVERYAELARDVSPLVWTRPWGSGEGEADDHLHLELGHVRVTPHGAAGEDAPVEDATK